MDLTGPAAFSAPVPGAHTNSTMARHRRTMAHGACHGTKARPAAFSAPVPGAHTNSTTACHRRAMALGAHGLGHAGLNGLYGL